MQDVLLAMRRNEMVPVAVSEATYILLDSVRVTPSLPWVYAVLLGRCVCNADFVTSDSFKGIALTFKGGIHSKRKIACSRSFLVACPEEARAIQSIAADDRSKWRMVTETDFLENEARGRAKESAFFSMILVSDDAKHNDALYRRMSNAFTLAAFLTFFGKLDLARSREGVCGR